MDKHAPSRWPSIILVFCLSVASAMVVSEGVPALGPIAAEFHPRSPAEIGLVMSIPALVVALGGLLFGWVVDRQGDRRMLLAGGIIMLLGDIGVAASSTLVTLLAWRVVGGIGYLSMAVAAVTMVMRITQGRERVAALALWSTVIPASFLMAFLAGALLVGHNWRFVFGTHALVSAALLIAGALFLPARQPGEAGVSRTQGIALVLRSPAPYALGVSFLAAAFLQSGMIAVFERLLSSRMEILPTQVHAIGILAMLFNMAAALSVGVMLNRNVPAWLIGAAGVLMAACGTLALRMLVATLPAAAAADCVLMLGCGLLAGMWALLPRVAPSPQTMGATSGLVTQLTLVGVLFGAPAAFAALGAGPIGFVLLVSVLVIGTAPAVPIWLRSGRAPSAATVAAGKEAVLF